MGPEQFPRVQAFERGLNRPERISAGRLLYGDAELLYPAFVRCFGRDILDQRAPGFRLADFSKEGKRHVVDIEQLGAVQILPSEQLLRVSDPQGNMSVQAVMGQPLRPRFDRLDDGFANGRYLAFGVRV